MPDSPIPIFISAGDPSGDIAGSHLLAQLKTKSNYLSFFGLGGPRMLAAGQEQIIDGAELAVLGFWEVAKRLLFFRRLMSQTVYMIRTSRPKVAVLIDYPGFNLRLAERIKPMGIPIVYYISPQIWAWGEKRIEKIKRLIDVMLLILPFEKRIYDQAAVRSIFVGHYLLDDMDERLIKAPYNIDSNLIVLMPGSRPQEVHRMLPTLLDTAELLSKEKKWRFSVAAVEGDIDYSSHIKKCRIPVEIARGKTRELILESRLVITSSGTATLETGVIGRPMVVIYKTGMLTYLIARRLIKLDKIALINIASGKKVVPELVQHDASPEKIAEEAVRLLESKELSLNVIKALNKTTESLGVPGASERAANAIWEYISC